MEFDAEDVPTVFNNTNFRIQNVIINETDLEITGPANVTINACLFQNNHAVDFGDTILSPIVM